MTGLRIEHAFHFFSRRASKPPRPGSRVPPLRRQPALLASSAHRFIEVVPTVLLPAYDADAPRRLAAMETIESPKHANKK